MHEERLVKLLKRKDLKAQKTAYNQYAGAVFSYAKRYVSNAQDAEEICSDVFMRVFENVSGYTYQGENSFWFWIRKITLNECLMRIRKRKIDFDDQYEQIENNIIEDPDIISRLSLKEVQNMVASLPDGYRTVFNLYVVESLSHKEISNLLNISEQTSKSQLFKARRALKNLLEKK